MTFDPAAFGKPIASLLAGNPLNALGPGSPNAELRPALEKLAPESLFAGKRIVDHDAARCCLSALWLRHDFLDESHTLSQEIESAEGSYWHGIMHRREPDYGNGKYWFRRVGVHPIFPALAAAARDIAGRSPPDRAAEFLTTADAWDPYRFIDLCEAIARGKSAAGMQARETARAEWELLFAYCYRAATGG